MIVQTNARTTTAIPLITRLKTTLITGIPLITKQEGLSWHNLSFIANETLTESLATYPVHLKQCQKFGNPMKGHNYVLDSILPGSTIYFKYTILIFLNL